MKNQHFLVILFLLFASSVFAQQTVVINDPNEPTKEAQANPEIEALLNRDLFPKLKKHWESDSCPGEMKVIGTGNGAFSKVGSAQTLVFFEYCQTGNGLGNNGVVLIENGKISTTYVSEGGWAVTLRKLPDINKNGLDEFALYYSGGMHQGQGGIGVDVMEFSAAGLKGLGWFQAESFDEDDNDYAYKVSTKTGKAPLFYREKYTSIGEAKWRKSGKATPIKLSKAIGEFKLLK